MKSMYKKLLTTVGIHFIIMYCLSYVVIDSITDAYFFSTRPLYMALVMVPPMIILMLYVMRSMYPNKKLNTILYIASSALFVFAFIAIRTQLFVGNEMFLKSMIPHHSGAITVCQESSITDPEIIQLCDDIVSAQKEEITQMKEILQRLK
tara:strand:- start:65 stop:514 length:450 start_codon:yes stop_codon:yes gene_type:complete